ncbi:MAG: DMT family transporter [Amaricoccus sp.]
MGRLAGYAALAAIAAAWALTLPLIRVAVSTGHRPLGLLLWQQMIMAAVLLALLGAMGKPLPRLGPNLGLMLVVAFFGTVLPGYFAFVTAAALPAGVRAIIIASVPMFVLPMALALGMERPDHRRAAGVLVGGAAMVLLGLPGAGPAAGSSAAMVLLALISPFSYALEASWIGWRGQNGLHPFQLLFGASLLGMAMAWPLAEATGQVVWPAGWGRAEWAMLAVGLLNAAAYSGYVWLIGRTGSVFASQIAYLTTGFAILWSMLLFGERYPAPVWLAFALILAGVALVQPRQG